MPTNTVVNYLKCDYHVTDENNIVTKFSIVTNSTINSYQTKCTVMFNCIVNLGKKKYVIYFHWIYIDSVTENLRDIHIDTWLNKIIKKKTKAEWTLVHIILDNT